MTPSRSLPYIANIILSIAVLWGAFWLVVGAWYTYPNAEDLGLASGFRLPGFGARMQHMLTFVDGRYAANFFHGISPLVWHGTEFYFLLPLLSAGLLTYSLYFFWSGLVCKPSDIRLFLFSTLVTVVFFSAINSTGETLYCWGGTLVYIFPCSFSLLWMGMAVRLFRSSETKYFLGAALFLFISIGFNAMFILFSGVALTLMWLYALRYEREKISFAMALSIVGGSGIMLMLLLPGFSRKIENNNPLMAQLLDRAFWEAFLQQFLGSVSGFFRSIPVLTAIGLIALFSPLNSLLRDMNGNKFKFFMLSCLLSLMLTLPMALIFYLPLYEAGYLYDRVYTTIQFFIFIASIQFFSGVAAVFYNSSSPIAAHGAFYLMLALLTVFGMVGRSNNYADMREKYASDEFAEFAGEMDKRFQAMTTASSTNAEWKEVTIEPLSRYPRTIYNPTEPLPNRQDINWNFAYEEYFRLDNVRLTGDTLLRFPFLYH